MQPTENSSNHRPRCWIRWGSDAADRSSVVLMERPLVVGMRRDRARLRHDLRHGCGPQSPRTASESHDELVPADRSSNFSTFSVGVFGRAGTKA